MLELQTVERPLSGKPGEKLSDTLYHTLKEMIVFGQIPPNERLMPEVLAEQFGVSATPVREALTRLAAERFIVVLPRRGFRAAQPSRQQIIDLWQVRYGLEAAAGELVIEALREGQLEEGALEHLRDLQEALERGLESGIDHRKHLELNAEFHQAIVELSGNQLLKNLYRDIQLHLIGAWVQRGLDSWRDRLSFEAEEHRSILQALKARDPAAYREAVHRHIRRSLEGALRDLEAQGRLKAGGA